MSVICHNATEIYFIPVLLVAKGYFYDHLCIEQWPGCLNTAWKRLGAKSTFPQLLLLQGLDTYFYQNNAKGQARLMGLKNLARRPLYCSLSFRGFRHPVSSQTFLPLEVSSSPARNMRRMLQRWLPLRGTV